MTFREPCITRSISTPSDMGRYRTIILSKPEMRNVRKEARSGCFSRGCHPIAGCDASRVNVSCAARRKWCQFPDQRSRQDIKLDGPDPRRLWDEQDSGHSKFIGLFQTLVE